MEKSVTISAADFKRMLDAGSVRFIFDLREEDEFRSWRIEGRTPIETLNIPRYRFVGEEEMYIDRFPKDKGIIAVCAHGDSSRYTAEQLQGLGYDIRSLEGGMDAWSEFYETTKVSDVPAVYQVFRVARGCISYLVSSGGEAVVIDAPRHIGRMEGLAEELKVKITRVLDTHLHADHVSGGRNLADRTGASYHLHPGDAGDAAFGYRALEDGLEVAVGTSLLRVVHSPGHTPGSTSFLLDGKFLFTGDTIMKESIGRPDLGGRAEEWATLLHGTLFSRFASLPDETVVLPAHAASIREQGGGHVIKTTLGEARRNGDLYQIKELQPFISHVKSHLLENPERYQEIRKVNLGRKVADEAGIKELEIGKNLCGMAKLAV